MSPRRAGRLRVADVPPRPARRLVARRRRADPRGDRGRGAAGRDRRRRDGLDRRRGGPSRGARCRCPATSSWSRRSMCRTRSLGPEGAAAVVRAAEGRDGRAGRRARGASCRRRDLPTAERAGAGAGGGIGGDADGARGGAPSRARRSWPPRPACPTRSTGPTCASRPRAGSTARPSRGKVVAEVADICRRSGVQCIAVGGIVEPVAAEELRRRGCETHQQGDLERAGRELASRSSSLSG